MNDFFKIFVILSSLVAAFLFGRNYGEKTFRDSEEYQSFLKNKISSDFNKNEFENLRAKFQNIVDGAATKKTDELLAQLLQVFTDDLGLKIENQRDFLKIQPAAAQPITLSPLIEKKSPREHAAVADAKKFHSYEWMLANSSSTEEALRNLKNVEIKSMDPFLKTATPATPQQMESIYGSYRGRLYDVTSKAYATIVIEINPQIKDEKTFLTGTIKMFKDGKETAANEFNTAQLGYAINSSSGFIIDLDNHYYQLYKVAATHQLAGFFYERLPQGTTNTIGHFALNRVDQF